MIELMIAVVVIGILAAIAIPSFVDSIRKSRRADAFNALAAIQQAQERWRSSHATYTTTLSDLKAPGASYYTLSVSESADSADTLKTSYVATAVANSGSTQASDAQCRRLSVLVQGGNIKYASCSGCEEFTYATTNECWVR